MAGLAVHVTVLVGGCAQPASRATTEAAITPHDLETRLVLFAHDSMGGRAPGTAGDSTATAYIADEVRRLGLEPVGDSGSFFQTVPLMTRGVDPDSRLSVGGSALRIWDDYAPLRFFGDEGSLDGAVSVYAGRLGDPAAALTADEVRGKLVVFDAPVDADGHPTFQYWNYAFPRSIGDARGVAIATMSLTPDGIMQSVRQPEMFLRGHAPEPSGLPLGMLITERSAMALFGRPLAELEVGALGESVEGTFRFRVAPLEPEARNVVALLRGADSARNGQFVVLGAHSDHVGVAAQPADHDSVRAYNSVMQPLGAGTATHEADAEETAAIKRILDSLRTIHDPRPDSVFNGADDDGSGTVAVLEIAEMLSRSLERPRRSILFVWHTAEETHTLGSRYFTEHLPVPRDSIVAMVNLDMVGRGRPDDVEDGGPGYVQVIGARRRSTALGDLLERVNLASGDPMSLDYRFDAPGHPDNLYCRSDQAIYARFGIPVVFLTTGAHRDVHELTDEPQYIDYRKLARVSGLARDLLLAVANQDERLPLDGPAPDTDAPCRQ